MTFGRRTHKDADVRRIAQDAVAVVDTIQSEAEFTGYTFGTWETPDPDNWVFVTIRGVAITDGTSAAEVFAEVDKSGGTTPDYQLVVAEAEPAGGIHGVQGNVTLHVPPGGSWRAIIGGNPQGINGVSLVRYLTLG